MKRGLGFSAVVVALLGLLSGCNTSSPATATPPTITNLTASSNTLGSAGGSDSLSWVGENVTGYSLSVAPSAGVKVNGVAYAGPVDLGTDTSADVTLPGNSSASAAVDYTFTLTAGGASGTTPASKSVHVSVAAAAAPVIDSFTSSTISGGAAYHWSVSDTDGGPLTCALDGEGDGVTDVSVPNCATITSQSYAFPTPGSYVSSLTVTDGQGHSTTATVPTIAAGTSTTPTTWTEQYGSSSTDHGYGVTVDADGNITLVGYTHGALPGYSSAGGYDIVLAKYDPDGNQLWTRQLGGSDDDYGYAVTTDADGKATLAGFTRGALPGFSNAGGYDTVLTKYDPNGNQLWTRQFGGSANDYGLGIAADADGNAAVVGFTMGVLPGHSSAGGYDIVLLKYDPDGSPLWTRQFGGSGDDEGFGVTVDADGNITLVGYTYGALPGYSNAGGEDIVLAKYDPNGNQLWTRQLGGSANDYAYDVTVDAAGNTTLVGYTTGALPGHSSSGGFDIVLATYDPDGNQLWTRQLGGSGYDYGYGVTVDAAGNATVVGYTTSALPGQTSAGENDIVLAKYDPDGNQLWTRQLGGSGSDIGRSGTTGPDGSTTLVGDTTGALPGKGSAGGTDFVLAKYLP